MRTSHSGYSTLARQALAVHILGREIQMQFQPRWRRFGDLAQADFVLIVGGLFGVVRVVIVDRGG